MVRKKAAGTWIHTLEITHRLLTRHTKGLVLVAKVSGRSQGLSSAGERGRGSTRRGWLSRGGELCRDEVP